MICKSYLLVSTIIWAGSFITCHLKYMIPMKMIFNIEWYDTCTHEYRVPSVSSKNTFCRTEDIPITIFQKMKLDPRYGW